MSSERKAFEWKLVLVRDMLVDYRLEIYHLRSLYSLVPLSLGAEPLLFRVLNIRD